MSIIQKQLTRLIEAASEESLKSGRVLDLDRITRIVQEKVRELDGGPTLKVRRQGKRVQFNLEAHNEMMNEVKFDLDTLYELIAEKAAILLNRTNSIEVSYKSQRAQLNAIRAAVDDLLFSTRNADDYFFGVFDNFSSLDKIDRSATTDGAVDLAEGVGLLPFSMPSAIRVDLSHMYRQLSGRIESKSADGSPAKGSTGAGTRYGYAFSDITSFWRYDVRSSSNHGTKMWITFPLRSDNDPVRITRVELSALSSIGMQVELLGSLDDQNYTRFQGAVQKTVTADTEKIAWDFPESTIRWIRLVFTKNSPDGRSSPGQPTAFTNPVLVDPPAEDIKSSTPSTISSVEDSWIYSYTINSIGVFRLGRTQDAIIQSKPLSPRDTPDTPIHKVSLQVEDEVAAHTSIDYSIALSDATGATATDFLPITPSNQLDSDVPKILQFGDSVRERVEFTANTGSIATGNWVRVNAVDHFPIYLNLNSTDRYQFGSNKLYRGGNLFSRRFNSREVTRSVVDNYIDFSAGDRTRQLYAFTDETARVFARNVGGGTTTKTFLSVTGPITQSIRPARESSDPPAGLDPEPDYAIASVDHVRSVMVVTDQPIQPSGTPVTVNGVQVPVAATWLGSSASAGSIGVPIIRNGQPVDIKPSTVILKWKDPATSFQYVFREEVDYSVKRSDDPYFNNFGGWSSSPVHWRIVPAEPSTINIQSGSPLSGQYGGTGNFTITLGSLPPISVGGTSLANNVELAITYEIDSDITHRVEQISYSSNEIQLDGLVEIMPGDSIIVNYRKVPSSIIRDSVRVTSNPGTENPGTIFQEGMDYSLDVLRGIITLSAGGAINALPTPVCYVDYSFREPVVETQTFSVWCYYDSREPLKFVYNQLQLRIGSGERFFWTATGQGSTDSKRIDNQTSFTLTRGWHQFTVQSLDPDSFSDAAIWRVLKLRDIEGKYLFLRTDKGGKIFSKITAFRAALRQVTYPFLLNATLKSDHSTFALDTQNKIFIKFPPAETAELWPWAINSSGVATLQTSEEFIFEGLRKITATPGTTNPGYLILRAHLSRSEDSNGGVTPKVHSYNIRIAY